MHGHVRDGWDPENHLETIVSEVLSGPVGQLPRLLDDAALLLACAGFRSGANRIASAWAQHDERPLPEATARSAAVRAWTSLWAATGGRPAWAEAIAPLDPAQAGREHRRALERQVETGGGPATVHDPTELGESTATTTNEAGRTGSDRSLSMLESLERVVSGTGGTATTGSTARSRAAELLLAAEAAAAEGRRSAAIAAVGDWAELARTAGRVPNAEWLAGCRALGGLIVAGRFAGMLGVDADWADRCAGELTRAVDTRFGTTVSAGGRELTWPELIRAVSLARAGPDLPSPTAPAPASAETVAALEDRLGVVLPAGQREFLRAADGLPGDVTFPDLLACKDIRPADADSAAMVAAGTPPGALLIGEGVDLATLLLVPHDETWRVLEVDSLLGVTGYPSVRQLLHTHLALLEHLA